MNRMEHKYCFKKLLVFKVIVLPSAAGMQSVFTV